MNWQNGSKRFLDRSKLKHYKLRVGHLEEKISLSTYSCKHGITCFIKEVNASLSKPNPIAAISATTWHKQSLTYTIHNYRQSQENDANKIELTDT